MPWPRRTPVVVLLSCAVLAGIVVLFNAGSVRQELTHKSRLEYSIPAHPNQAAFAPQAAPPAPQRRVAIVGAGAAGASAAFFLRRAARHAEARAGLSPGSLLDDIVVYEQNDYIGGRSTIFYPHGDTSLAPHELGASIFVDANQNLVKAVKLFNLSLDVPPFSSSGVAIWDGERFVLETSSSKSRFSNWWDTLTVIRRYGVLSPYRQNKAVKELLRRFQLLYQPEWLARRGVVNSIIDFVEPTRLGLGITAMRGQDWATYEAGVTQLWMDEIMEASTRVNYCADMDTIHGLGAAVSLAAAGASSVAGGNYQIFERMLADAHAEVHLRTEVVQIVPGKQAASFRVVSNSSKGIADDEFDQVFFAAPWHLSSVNKSLSHAFSEPIPKQDYVHLHVTMLTTTAPWPNPAYFGIEPDRAIPGTILTTNATARETGQNGPPFQSISYHGETFPGSGEYVVKLFSKTKLGDEFLTTLFNSTPTSVFRKEWDSYPVLTPQSTFRYAPVEPMPGFQYLAALEPWVSTMETQTISAREAVARVANRWWGLGLGQCDHGESWDMTCE